MSTDLDTFTDQAERINAAHREAKEHAARAIERAIEAGDLLLDVKATLKHGQWLPWLSQHCPDISARTAQSYMRVARELPAEKRSAAYLSIREALKALDAPADSDLSDDLDPVVGAESILDSPLPPDTPANDAAPPHVSHNSGNNEWYTPPAIVDAARAALGGTIDLDPASNPTAQNTVKASRFFTREDDGLVRHWEGSVFLNPPYAQPAIGQFADKLAKEVANSAVTSAVVLVNNATETAWFHTLSSIADAICLPRRRLRFSTPDGEAGAPLQGQAVIYIGRDVTGFTRAFSEFGPVWIPAMEVAA